MLTTVRQLRLRLKRCYESDSVGLFFLLVYLFMMFWFIYFTEKKKIFFFKKKMKSLNSFSASENYFSEKGEKYYVLVLPFLSFSYFIYINCRLPSMTASLNSLYHHYLHCRVFQVFFFFFKFILFLIFFNFYFFFLKKKTLLEIVLLICT